MKLSKAAMSLLLQIIKSVTLIFTFKTQDFCIMNGIFFMLALFIEIKCKEFVDTERFECKK